METQPAPAMAPEKVSLEAKSPFEMRVHLGEGVPDTDVRTALKTGDMGFLHSYTTGSAVDGPGIGTCGEAVRANAPIVCADIANDERWPLQWRERCAAHGILIAAHAQGIGAVWRTGDMAFDAHVHKGLGLAANEELICDLYVGTPLTEPRTAPILETADFVSAWGE